MTVVVLVGRPNVGKSTLFNQLTRTRDAIVADFPGLTRDRQYGRGRVGEHPYMVVDTGGIGEGTDGISAPMSDQALQAMEEADLILFLVDGRAGLLPADEEIAAYLRKLPKPVHLVVNKTDGMEENTAMADFYSLGFSCVHPIAASHGRGVQRMMEIVLDGVHVDVIEEPSEDEGICVAILGRPNVGKSTLVNRMLGEERVVVFDQAGTTRDAVKVPFERRGQRYTLIDTAGIRRRGRVNETVEKFSVIKALQAMAGAHVVVLVLDAREGITDQDLSILAHTVEAGRSLLIAVNKWDGLDPGHKEAVRREIDRRLVFIPWARVHYISALHGTGVGDLYDFILAAWQSAFCKASTGRLTRLLETLTAAHQPPLVGRHRARLRFAHLGGSNPPVIVVHGNKVEDLPDTYRRYLENRFREELKLEGTPVRLECRNSTNPYAGKRNLLTPRQIRRRRRLMSHVRR